MFQLHISNLQEGSRMLVTGFRIPELAYYGTNTRGLLAVSLFEMKSNVRFKKKYRYISMFPNSNRESSYIAYQLYDVYEWKRVHEGYLCEIVFWYD